MQNSSARWIAKTAVFLALLIVFQAATAALNMTLVTGSLVNFTLIMAVMLAGLSSGITVAAISPVLAFILGIGPKLLPLIPCIMIGNIVLVLVWHFVLTTKRLNVMLNTLIALVGGAGLKFLVLYLLIVKFLLGMILTVPPVQNTLIATMFTLPQLITALIGGIVAAILLPVLTPLSHKIGWS
ncbi:ECF transporter S component [Loigolactobacillus binensis]|uniref:ECF transporter S component n=1 Tax=Loigolactobacillus binensis TaxID=2559922 RepID=A0ABW3EBD5_9LACO|nr:ECF transporter S component [Loigolactobacillus binensis]